MLRSDLSGHPCFIAIEENLFVFTYEMHIVSELIAHLSQRVSLWQGRGC